MNVKRVCDLLVDDAYHGGMTRWQAFLEELKMRLGCQSQAQLARRLGVSQSTVSRWMSGDRPSADDVIKVAQRLGEDPVRLLQVAGYIEAMTPPEPGQQLSPRGAERIRYFAALVDSLDDETWAAIRTLAERVAQRGNG